MNETPPTEDTPVFLFPKAETMDDVNANFSSTSEHFDRLTQVMKAQTDHYNEALITLASETRDNIEKVSQDVRSVLSSQTMMMVICIIVIMFFILFVKSAYEGVSVYIQSQYSAISQN